MPSQVTRQLDQMIRFIKQEAEEKARELMFEAEEVRLLPLSRWERAHREKRFVSPAPPCTPVRRRPHAGCLHTCSNRSIPPAPGRPCRSPT